MRDKDLPVSGLPGKVVLGVVGNAVEGRWDHAQRSASAASGHTLSDRVADVSNAYVRQLALLGAAAGGTAAVPGVGTITALGAATAEVGAFAHRATEMILAIGATHGHTGAEAEERKAWVLAVLTFGTSAAAELGAMTAALSAEAAKDDKGWFHTVNRSLGRKLLARWGARRGVALLGKVLPFGIGAAFGAGTNYAVARRIARNADRFFAALSQRERGIASGDARMAVGSAAAAVAAAD